MSAAKRLPVGLQLYSVREDCKRDFPAVLTAVAKMGYDGVEFAGYHGLAARDLRAMLDDLGLSACGTHTGLATLQGDELMKTVEFNRVLGNRFLIVPGVDHKYFTTRAGCQELAGVFNDIAESLAGTGMEVGYHNHMVEFQPIPGEDELPWDLFFGATDKRVVMQFDTGNALRGGAEPVQFLQRYPGRAKTVHLKEWSASKDQVLLGEGDVPWQKVFDLCESTGGTQWYVIEQETYPVPPMDAVAQCLQGLRKLGR